jgi:hypothetical protein
MKVSLYFSENLQIDLFRTVEIDAFSPAKET